MAFAIGGLASGLDTTNMISQLMQVEARPQYLLKNKVSTTQSLMSALQQLNTRVSTLGSQAEKVAKAGALDLYKATSTSDKVSATTSADANAGSIDFHVKQLAQAQVSVSALISDWPEDASVLTIALQDGRSADLDIAGKDLDGVIATVNGANTGVRAVKVATGTEADPEYRIQFTATESGQAGGFSVHRTQGNQTDGETVVDLLVEPGAFEFRPAQDAEVVFWQGTGAEHVVSSSSNTFEDLLPGVDVSLSGVTADPVTVRVARDDAGITRMAKELVDGLAGLFSYISTNSSVSTSSSSGSTVARGGIFTGDSSVRDIEQRILRAATSPVEGRSPSEIGISITKNGSVEFNAEKFAKALAEDPAWVEKAAQEIAARVSAAATDASDKQDGAITLRIQGQESLVRELSTQVDEWDRRLEMRRTTLERTWSALEVTLSNLQSQGDYLTSQLASLPSYGSRKS